MTVRVVPKSIPSRMTLGILRRLSRDGQEARAGARMFFRGRARNRDEFSIFTANSGTSRVWGLARLRAIGGRQLDHEAGALVKTEVQGNAAPHGLDQTATDRETETGPLADLFGGDERLEQSIAY